MTASLEPRLAASASDGNLHEARAEALRALHGRLADRLADGARRDAFFVGFLTDLTQTLAVEGGAVWTADDGRPQLVARHRVEPGELAAWQDRVADVLRTGVGATAAPAQGALRGPALLYPIRLGTTVCGVVLVIAPPDASRAAVNGLQRTLVPLCDFAAEFFYRHEGAAAGTGRLEPADGPTDGPAGGTPANPGDSGVAQFALDVHRRLDMRRTAATIANEGRRRADCDRLSVCLYRHRRAEVIAVSGQDFFDRRSNLVRRMEELATAVAAAGEPLVYPDPQNGSGGHDRLAPQVEQALEAYLDESQARQLLVLPLYEPGSAGDDESGGAEQAQESAAGPGGPVVGILLAEQIAAGGTDTAWRRRVELPAPHAASALANAERYDAVPLRLLARSAAVVGALAAARNLPRTVLVAGSILVVIVALWIIPYPYAVEARGNLQPVVRRDVFAAVDGTVEKILVRTGDRAAQGDVLFELRNNELDVAEADLIKQINENEQELLNAQRAYNEGNRTLTGPEQNRLLGQIAVFETRRDSLRRQAELFGRKREQLRVRSPMNGQVATWNVAELLAERPVRRGQTLVGLVDSEGEWELEIRVPEDRFGHVAEALGDGREAEVTFVLATDPAHEYRGTVTTAHLTAEPHGDEGNVVRVRAKLDKRQLARLQNGADVRVRIDCGNRSLGYVMLGDVWAFVQSRILFKL